MTVLKIERDKKLVLRSRDQSNKAYLREFDKSKIFSRMLSRLTAQQDPSVNQESVERQPQDLTLRAYRSRETIDTML